MLEIYSKSPNLVILQDPETEKKLELTIYPDGSFKLAKKYNLLGAEEEFYETIPEAINNIQFDLAIIRRRITTIVQIATQINFSMNTIEDSDLSDKTAFTLYHIDHKRQIIILFQEESYNHADRIAVEYYQSLPRSLLWKKVLDNDLNMLITFFRVEFKV